MYAHGNGPAVQRQSQCLIPSGHPTDAEKWDTHAQFLPGFVPQALEM